MMKFVLMILVFITQAKAQEVHFFGSLDYGRTTTPRNVKYLEFQNSSSMRNLTTAGMNASAKFNDKSQGLVQFIHSPLANKIVTDLVQFQHSFSQDIKTRIGRQRLPLFLKSEVIQVKALYPWLIPPAEVYNQNPLRSFNGGSLEKNWDDVSVQLYGGSVEDEIHTETSVVDVDSDRLLGARFNYTKGSFDFYVNGSRDSAVVTITSEAPIAAGVNGTAEVKEKIRNSNILTSGFSWDSSKWLLMGEYIQVKTDSNLIRRVKSAYGSLGHHFSEKFLGLVTYSTEIEKENTASPSKSTTYSLSGQYSLDDNVILKLGASHVNFRRRVKPSTFSATGSADTGLGLSANPGGNFNVYDAQLAFIF